MVSPYTVGVCVRSVFVTSLFVSISLSTLYVTYHALRLSDAAESTDDEREMKQQMAAIDFRLKDAAHPVEVKEEEVFEHPSNTTVSTPVSTTTHRTLKRRSLEVGYLE
jgi:hypothetical protein